MSTSNHSDSPQMTELYDIEKGTLDKVSLEDVYNSEEHFVNKLSLELDKIKNKMSTKGFEMPSDLEKKDSDQDDERDSKYLSNSPLTMSIVSSPPYSDCDSDTNTIQSKFRKLTYEDVERSLDKHYTRELRLSNELDILITYLKGQKHLFNQAKHVTNQKFDFMMYPALFITAALTVVSPFMNSVGWSGWVVSILNAILTVVITINNFMKFQAVAAIFQTMSNQYDKLCISVEMTKNQFYFVENEKERTVLIIDKMKETEKRIMDIQYNYNDTPVPYEVRLMNPIISHINIFSFIKKIELHKRTLIMKYRDVKNEIRFLLFKWEKNNETVLSSDFDIKKEKEVEALKYLMAKKEDIKKELVQNNNNNVYSYIDNLFIREMQHSDKYYTYSSAGMYIFLRPKPYTPINGNPVVDEYLNFVFKDT